MSISLNDITIERKNRVKSSSVLSGPLNFAWLNKDIKLLNRKISDKKKENFYCELGILLSSGIDIKTSLEIIVKEQKKDSEKKLFAKIHDDVVSGTSLSQATLTSGRFSMYEYYSLKIGEESGTLNEVLGDLTDYFSKKIRQRRQVVSALTYPLLVIMTAILSVCFMMVFIVPLFEDVFKRFQGELPSLTQFIISISEAVSNNIGNLFLLILGLIILYFFIRKKNWYRKIISAIALKTPVFGEIIKKVYLARFCQSMALLIGSKTPMLRSIQLVSSMLGFYPYEKALKKIESDILHGKNLYQGMEGFSIFDAKIVSLTKVAEEVNQLDTIFNKLNLQYSDEVEHKIKILSNLLEPVMILLVGVLVAVILISMYLPLFQLSSSFI